VLELRLQKAYRLLTDARHADRKVIDIALSCGFNDVSYFHRSFRGRFGMTPSDARAAAAAPPHSAAVASGTIPFSPLVSRGLPISAG
jgi:AraC-like DNA-binding protein